MGSVGADFGLRFANPPGERVEAERAVKGGRRRDLAIYAIYGKVDHGSVSGIGAESRAREPNLGNPGHGPIRSLFVG